MVKNHIKKKHDHLNAEQKNAIFAWVNRIKPKLSPTREDVPFPNESVPPIEGLAIHTDKIMCPRCRQIYGGHNRVENMDIHNKKEHGIVLHGRSGRPSHSEKVINKEKYANRYVEVPFSQQFFLAVGKDSPKSSRAASFFEVTAPVNSNATTSTRAINVDYTPDSEIKRLYADAKRRVAEVQREQQRVVPHEQRAQVNAFIQATKWQSLLGGWEMDALLRLRSPPDKESEAPLYIIWQAVRSMIKICQNTLAGTSRAIRLEVLRDGESVPKNPLEPYTDERVHHGLALQYIIIFFCRTSGADPSSHPPYCMTPAQRKALDNLLEYAEACDTTAVSSETSQTRDRTEFVKIERLCHIFWLSLLRQEVERSDSELAVLTAIAVLCVNSNGFQSDQTCATSLVALKKMARFSFIYECEHLSEFGHASTETPFGYIKKWTAGYLNIVPPTPMQWIISMTMLARAGANSVDSKGFVSWEGGNLTCQHVTINVTQYRGMVWSLYDLVVANLLELLFCNHLTDLPAIPWLVLQEDFTNSKTGWHLFSGQHQPALCTVDQFIFGRLEALSSTGNPRTIPRAWRSMIDITNRAHRAEYSNRVQRFLTLLATLIHLCYGQPARGKELLSVHFENNIANGLRNIFVLHGLLVLVTRYHKRYNYTRVPKNVYRFLPRAVGSLVFWYLWLVLPHYRTLQSMGTPDMSSHHYARAHSSLLFPGPDGQVYETSSILGDKVSWATRLFMGVSCTLLLVRHMIIAIGRKLAGQDAMSELLDSRDVALMAGSYHRIAVEEQSGHTAKVGMDNYALPVDELDFGSTNVREQQMKISTIWHHFLGFPILEDHKTYLSSRARAGDHLWETSGPTASAVTSVRVDREAKRARVDIQGLLEEEFGQRATFRGKQQQVIRAVFQGDSPIAYISATGSGKSLAFELPALWYDFGLTIVIVPLVGLRTDLTVRLEKLNISYTEWSSSNQREDVSILLAMPEHLGHEAFRDYLQRTRSSGRLSRIVVDEVHYLLLVQEDFRIQLRDLRAIVDAETPITMLSATIPPDQEKFLWREMGLGDAHVHVHRERTSRPNIQYEVQRFDYDFTENDIFDDICQDQGAHPDTMSICWIQDTQMIDRLAKRLDCLRYHGGMTKAERSSSLKALQASASRTMLVLATSALGHGFHEPRLRRSIHYGKPTTLIHFAQEAGRVGRDGSPSVARVVVAPGLPDFTHKESELSRRLVEDFLGRDATDSVCRRKALDGHLDGDQDRQMCLMPSERACDVCHRTIYLDDEDQGPASHATHDGPLSEDEPLIEFDGGVGSFSPLDDEDISAIDPRILFQGTTTPRGSAPGQAEDECGSDGVSDDALLRVERSTTRARSPPRAGGTLQSLPFSPKRKGPGRTRDVASSSLTATAQSPGLRSFRDTMRSETTRDVVTSPTTTMDTPCPAPAGPTRRAEAGVARRARERHAAAESERDKVRASAAYAGEKLTPVLRFWSERCIVCYSKGRSYDHAKGTCHRWAGTRVGELRKKLKCLEGHCWRCLLPYETCDRYRYEVAPGTGRLDWRPQPDQSCQYQRTLSDVWLIVWLDCPRERELMSQRLQREKPGAELGDADWAAWYSGCRQLAPGCKLSRVVEEVVWLTHEQFLA